MLPKVENYKEKASLFVLNEPFFEDYKSAFAQTLKSGWYILGDNVKAFEAAYALYCKSKYAIGVASGLDALTLSLKALDLEKNSDWNLVNLKNYRMFDKKVTSTGITLLTRKA